MKKQLLSIALSLTLIVQTFPALGSTTIQGNNTFNAISTNLSNETEYKAGNPIITNIFTADPSAHVWEENGRIYIYASHDMMPAKGCGNMDKYHVYSSDTMVTWKDEGEILSAADVSWGRSKGGLMWAPDAAHVDDTYYFYFPHPTGNDDWNSTWRIGVATSKKPTSDFTCKYDGYVKMKDGSPYVTKIDPCIFKDDDGSYYLYTGGGSKCYVAKLSSDMQTLSEDPVEIDETLDDFHEGMWIFKRNGIYYAMYADNTSGHNLMRYSTSNSPYGPFKDGGVILDATSCDTTHGSIVEYKNHWYMFYHNSDLSGRGNLRSVCVDEVFFNEDGSIKSQIMKFLGEDTIRNIGEKMGAKGGDLVLMIADKPATVARALGELRLEMARRMNMIDQDKLAFTWVTDFPMFEYNEDEKRYVAMHHPFTMPRHEDLDKLESDPGSVKAIAYDMVLNGVEIGGGSLRIYQSDVQEKVFKAIGLSEEEAKSKFGFMLDAFQYGAPPHAGCAFGLDRLVMLMAKRQSIRDVIAFPKTQSASDIMSQAPSEVEPKQLKELHIKPDVEEEQEQSLV